MFEANLTSELMEYDASNIRFQQFKPSEPKDRQRVFFVINNKEKAIKCYEDFSFNRDKVIEGARFKIYLQKPEEILVKFGDIEAKKYYEEQERL